MKNVILNFITGETVAVIVTESMHLNTFMEAQTMNGGPVFVKTTEDVDDSKAEWQIVAMDNSGEDDTVIPVLKIVGNLDDADLLVSQLNKGYATPYYFKREKL